MKFPNKYLRNLKPYKVASHKVWAVTPEDRPNLLKLDWNESTIPPSPKVRETILALLDQPSFFNLYPETNNERLVTAISEYVGISKENVQYFASSDALHEYICKVFISVGDPVMILGPSYDNFRLTCQANGADVYFSYFDEDFLFNPSRFEADIIDKEPALVYICNPNNPTGYIHQPSYIEHLLESFPDTLFLIDEAYYEFSKITVKDYVLKYDNLIISRTMSKAFGLANFRIGYLIASKENIQFVNKIRNPKNLSTIAQEAACAALQDTHYMWSYVDEVNEAKAIFYEEMKPFQDIFKVFHSEGNFVLLEFRDNNKKMEFIQYLNDNNIFVRNTTQSNMVANCIRITIGTRTQMNRVTRAISRLYD